MKYFSVVYNCFLWAMIISITCFRSMWLQMRVNTGYIFWGGWVLLTAALCLILWKKRKAFGLIFSMVNLLICTLYAFILYGFKRIQVVPAAIIREGLHQSTLKFAVINQFVLIFLAAGMALIIIKACHDKHTKGLKIIVFICLIIVILILNHIFGWSAYISDVENLAFLEQMVKDNIWLAVGIYIILTIISCVILALPGITFAILAGLLFGPVLGTICCSLATTAGAVLAFLTGRFFLKDSIKPMVVKNKYLKKMLFDSSGRNDIFILMITRLVPLFPYNLQNFAYGVTDIKFSTYTVCSLLFMLPGTAMYTVGTAGLADKNNRWLYLGIAAGLALLVLSLGAFFKKKYVQYDSLEESVEEKGEDT